MAEPTGGNFDRHRLLPLRFDRHEMAGSVGDIGVMIPLAVGVAAAAQVSLVSVFLCVAASYAVSALVFRVPLPVQPMKAMGATIVALGLSASVVGAAGIEVAILLLLLAVTPIARHLARIFPRAVLRGIQLAVGLLLLKSALVAANDPAALPGTALGTRLAGAHVSLGLLLALAVAAGLFAGTRRRRLPASLVVVGLGAALGLVFVFAGFSSLAVERTLPALLSAHLPSAHDAWLALFVLVLPQLPLSLGNSVYATEDVVAGYYGSGARRVTAKRLLVSLGLMNLATAALGGMPLCHGAGGATAHYRLGARTAGATLLAAALFAGLAVASAFGITPLLVPGAVLAGMLLFVGVEHCLLIADLATVDEVACALLVAVLAMATDNLAVGFVGGWVVFVVALRRSPLQHVVLRWPRLVARLAPRPAGEEVEAG